MEDLAGSTILAGRRFNSFVGAGDRERVTGRTAAMELRVPTGQLALGDLDNAR